MTKSQDVKSQDAKRAPSRRRVIKAAGLLAAGAAAPSLLRIGAALAAYPDRPIKIVVANTPGGPSDIIARFMAASMQEVMGGSVIVENKGGGGGNIGMGSVARADADGYTILLSTSAYSVNPGLYETLPYDPFKDFAAICELAVSPHVFAVKPDLPAKTMKEFVALAKADPDKFNVSTPPIGTTPQLQAEVLKLREGLQKMATIVFPGGGDALKALLSGTVQLSSGVLAPAHPQIKAGTIKEAERLLGVYRSQGWDSLGIIHSDRNQDENEEVIARVRGEKDGVRLKPSERLAGFVSVDMAGEGDRLVQRVARGDALPHRRLIENAELQHHDSVHARYADWHIGCCKIGGSDRGRKQ